MYVNTNVKDKHVEISLKERSRKAMSTTLGLKVGRKVLWHYYEMKVTNLGIKDCLRRFEFRKLIDWVTDWLMMTQQFWQKRRRLRSTMAHGHCALRRELSRGRFVKISGRNVCWGTLHAIRLHDRLASCDRKRRWRSVIGCLQLMIINSKFVKY